VKGGGAFTARSFVYDTALIEADVGARPAYAAETCEVALAGSLGILPKSVTRRGRLSRCASCWASCTSAARSLRAPAYVRAPRTAYITRLRFTSPTHKRTEGRAPMWGSEFTKKFAH
jgi:hypothetical protein